jgi:hypothetical protein
MAGFKVTKEDLKKSQKCPVGMHVGTLVEVEEQYFNEKGTSVQKCVFETDAGYQVPVWFNDKVMSNLIEFVEAADKIKLDMATMADMDIRLENYKGRRVAFSVSHQKDKNNKMQSQIDNFFNADKVPF